MPRKIFTISEADAKWLAREAARLGVSEAHVVRTLVREARDNEGRNQR